MVVQQTFKYRIYPSRKQVKRLFNNFNTCKQVYNELLELSINNYKETKKNTSKFDFDKHLSGKHKEVYSQVRQNVSDRVSKSFKNFFRRIKDKSCKHKGFPRFKSSVCSITYPQSGFKFINEKKIYASKIGNIPIVIHRVPKGKIKTMTIKRNKSNQWFACFSCEVENKTKQPLKDSVGIDVGLEYFATLSNGEHISNPRYLIQSERRLSRLQRRLSKKKKGSKNRLKAKHLVARQYNKITNQRFDFLHKLSHNITQTYSFIAVEDLEIKSMVNNKYLAKHIHDASWSNFIQMLSYKAVTSGGQLIKVNPRGTSKICNKCGVEVDMPLSKRKFKCSHCGFVCHRDINSALNIYDRAGLARISTPVGDTVRPSLLKASVVESGTIYDTV